MFWQNFQFPAFSLTGIFFGHFPCFPCAVVTMDMYTEVCDQRKSLVTHLSEQTTDTSDWQSNCFTYIIHLTGLRPAEAYHYFLHPPYLELNQHLVKLPLFVCI